MRVVWSAYSEEEGHASPAAGGISSPILLQDKQFSMFFHFIHDISGAVCRIPEEDIARLSFIVIDFP